MNKTTKLNTVDYSDYFEAYSLETMGVVPKRTIAPARLSKTISKKKVLELACNFLAAGSIFFFAAFTPLLAGVCMDLLGK